MSLIRRHKILPVCLLLLFFSGSLLCWFLFLPPSRVSSRKIIMIKKGTPLRKISAVLEQEGIIRNKDAFIGMVTLLGKKREIKAGEYEFHTRMLPLEVLDSLVKGQARQHLVTIPEGFTATQIGQFLEDLSIVEKKAFLDQASSPSFITSLGLPREMKDPNVNLLRDSPKNRSTRTLEGYLFPNTYHFIKEMEPEEAIRMMVHQFQKVFGAELVERASHLRIDPADAVILASIIEKEASLPDEKPLVSAVFHNRLKKKIPLQSDPTVIYGIKDFDGNLTREHLATPTPYNTYLFLGLPPTPICNPGKDSILAALYPAPAPYLYFVSKNDGSHHFSEGFEEHQRAVAKYQKLTPRKN
jgi:UPF0755 protein